MFAKTANRIPKCRLWLTSFGITIIYSFIYGLLEYFLFHSPSYDGILRISRYFSSMYYYWGFMLLSAVILIYLFCRNWTFTALSLLLFWVMEDFFYWMGRFLATGRYPFPAPNWYDNQFVLFRMFGLGEATIFFPYFPRFYYIVLLLYALGMLILSKLKTIP